jgi:hypothetical protein
MTVPYGKKKAQPGANWLKLKRPCLGPMVLWSRLASSYWVFTYSYRRACFGKEMA